MEKTIKEWLETLPEPYRTEALDETKGRILKTNQGSLTEAIERAFIWADTPRGAFYWDDVRNRAEAGEFNNNSLDKDSEK